MTRIFLLFLITFLSAACSKDTAEPEVTIDAKTLELNYDKQHQFEIRNRRKSLDARTFVWKSSDDKVASISNTGRLIGRKIGATTITATLDGKTYSSYVTILPYVTTFSEPFLEFGADRSTVKTKVTDLLAEETDDFLVYQGISAGLEKIIYTFKDNHLIGSTLDFSETAAVKKEATTYIKERYPLIAVTATDTAYINDARTRIVFLNTNESLGFNASYGQIVHEGGRVGAYSKDGKPFFFANKKSGTAY